MLKWTIGKNTIQEVSWNGGENFILPWGVETADSWSFFSLEKEVGYRHSVTCHKVEIYADKLIQSMNVHFKSGEFHLHCEDFLGTRKIERATELIVTSDLHLMDFVQRYRFKKSCFDEAQINGKTIKHTDSNVYNQFPVREVCLKGKTLSLKINILEFESASKFEPTMYVRDRGDEWIVHIRMMPIQKNFVVIKLCSRWFRTSPLPRWLSNKILSFDNLKNELLYRAERKPYTSKLMRAFSPNAFPMAGLKKNERLYWKSKMEIE